MEVSKDVAELMSIAYTIAKEKNYEYISPELLLLALCDHDTFYEAIYSCGGEPEQLEKHLSDYLDQYVKVEEMKEPTFSENAAAVLIAAEQIAAFSGKKVIELTHILRGIFSLKDCHAVYYLRCEGIEETELLQTIMDIEENGGSLSFGTEENFLISDEKDEGSRKESMLEQYAPCMNEQVDRVNPLIGRENELERTIQILCRKDKNNPLHIGEPGVGKTALTYGLARLIEEGKVPEALKGAKIYSLDLGNLLAGTQYRGEFEKRLKRLLEEISREDKPILYIDEIHNLTGAGAAGESSFDASNMMKPYLAEGKVRFIGATTFEEYKKHFEKNKSLVRRFQNVEMKEPSEEETIQILKGLKKQYESFHGVSYGKGVLEYAVTMSRKYVNERFLPDKAIDLIDEAGAYRKIHPLEQKKQTVGKDVINEILTKICRIPVEASENEKTNGLLTLKKRILSKIFGQDEAVEQVVNAIKFSKAGLTEEQKPLASFLFAGPTGVGKTQIAKTLALELGISLVRFDMSEYGEKHTIAKLIGSPAGYVGYEEGGLLTESVRKNPSCVLLLDEIEKAHPDIFHVLLQVMDYATLTDNQGRKADFRNVIIIMTSNVGASRVGKPGFGFMGKDVTSDVIMEEVKRTFQPEFRNRLNRIVVFASMDDEMAERIAEKKLNEMAELLLEKKVVFSYSAKAAALLKKKGSSREYGAREMDRVILSEIKTLLVDELLSGKLKKGGNCRLDVVEDSFVCSFAEGK